MKLNTKHLAISLAAFLASAVGLFAGNGRSEVRPRVKYGIEWGYTASLLDVYHFNYIDAVDGYRIDREGCNVRYYSNGFAAIHTDLEFAGRYSASIFAGYAGIQQWRRFFPISARFTYFLDSYTVDGILFFVEGGRGVHDGKTSVISGIYKAGAGYRMTLSRRFCMDLAVSLQMTTDHPDIYDTNISDYVSAENLRRSDSKYGGINFSVNISF